MSDVPNTPDQDNEPVQDAEPGENTPNEGEGQRSDDQSA